MTNGVVPRCRQPIVINHFIIIFIERYKNQQIHHPRCRQRSVHWLLNLVSRYCCSSSSFLWRVVFDNLDIDVVKNDILAYRAFSLLNVPCLRCHVNTSKKRKSLPRFGLIQNFKKKMLQLCCLQAETSLPVWRMSEHFKHLICNPTMTLDTRPVWREIPSDRLQGC